MTAWILGSLWTGAAVAQQSTFSEPRTLEVPLPHYTAQDGAIAIADVDHDGDGDLLMEASGPPEEGFRKSL